MGTQTVNVFVDVSFLDGLGPWFPSFIRKTGQNKLIVISWILSGKRTQGYLQSATYLVDTLSFNSTFSVPKNTTLFIVQ